MATKKDKKDSKMIFHGELIGIPRNERAYGKQPIVRIKFEANGAMIVTLGNDNFLPSKKDLIETRSAIENVAKVLDIDKAKVVVGAWMDRLGKK